MADRNYEELLKLLPQIQYEFTDPRSPTVAAVRDQFRTQASSLSPEKAEEVARALLIKQFNDSRLGGVALTDDDFKALNGLEHQKRVGSLTEADLVGLIQGGKMPQGTTLDQARQHLPADDYFGPQRSFYMSMLPKSVPGASSQPLPAPSPVPKPAAAPKKPRAPLPASANPQEATARGVLDMLMNVGEQRLPLRQ